MNHKLRILLLEDVPADAELVEVELRGAQISFTSRRVDTKDTFLKEVANSTPDVILADFALPQFNGLEALSLLKNLKLNIPFILVTGSQSEEVAVECMKAGADDYILKTSLRRLPSALVNVVAKHTAEREKIEAEDAFRRSEQRYRLITENTRDLICMVNLEGVFTYVSPSSMSMLGYTPAECMMTSFYSLIHPADRARVQRAVRDAFSKRGSMRLEYRFNHKRGDWRILESVWSWILAQEGDPGGAVVVSRDITDRRQGEEQLKKTSQQLRALAARLQAAREEERIKIAREIHDELGQILTALKIDLTMVDRRLSGQPDDASVTEAKAEIASMERLIETTIQTVRKIATELRPDVLDNLGFVEAVQWQAQEFEQRSAIPCRVSLPEKRISLDQEKATAVFRIFQETLTNVARHANATSVEVGLERTGGDLILTVSDNGRGITDEEIEGTASLGLLGMRERSHLFGGEVSITRREGGGTTVSVRIPLADEVIGAGQDDTRPHH
ncbi:MAG TPA: PAS domain S-box protein [Bacteroidota bacterium]|nr:PAS domain S-box protein [Bacteroidota bacterium]